MKNKNNKIKIVTILVAMVCLWGIYTNFSKTSITYNKNEAFSATYVVPNNLNELEVNTPIIVKGYFNGVRKIDNDKNLVGPSSISGFKISEVVKGQVKDEIIPVVEPCKFENGDFSNVEGYIPMEENQEYMLYIRPNDTKEGTQYSIVSLNFGKYNLSDKEGLTPFTREINSYDEVSGLDFVTSSQDICLRYNDIKGEITEFPKGQITTYSYSAQVLTKDSAFYEFRIIPSKDVKIYLDSSVTDNYTNHTGAFNNAMDKISHISDTDISFNRVAQDKANLILSSTSSSKEEWVGIARITYNEFVKPAPTLISAKVFINDYKINASNLTKEHTYQVALHELGHCFGLLHQDQLLENESIMVPYITPMKAGQTDFYNLDKHNLTYAYPKYTDWKDSWAKNQIDEFVDKGYIKGYPDGTFRPDASITRAEFVKIINTIFGLTSTSGATFEDTKSHWAKNDIDIAVTNKVAGGVSSTSFNPDAPITREEAAKMISNYKKLDDSVHNKLDLYKDANQVSNWAKNSVEGVMEAGYMNGYPDSTFRPKNNISRAEAVVTLSRVK